MWWPAATSGEAPVLHVRDVTVHFDGSAVLDQVSLHVERGEIVALLGPSGSGKSTLLRVIAGIVAPDSGRVVLDGVDVSDLPTHRRSIGMVFQAEQLFPHLTVAGNVGFGLRMQRVPPSAQRERVAALLSLVGLAGFGDRRIDGLSGGERKRVALARSLAPSPAVLLLDEPLTGLDRDLHDRLAGEVRDILLDAGVTAVWVTHDAAEAAVVATRTVVLGANGTTVPAVPDIVEIAATDTHELRRRVLRDGTPSVVVTFDGDELDSTFHLGCRRDGQLIGVSTWMLAAYPDRPAETAYQLRGMATEPALQGTGIGEALLLTGVQRCRDAGAALVWARARDTALGFYERHGFEPVGLGYVDLTTNLPHHDVVRAL
jgi:thiamine transport system ATP-binding protein